MESGEQRGWPQGVGRDSEVERQGLIPQYHNFTKGS